MNVLLPVYIAVIGSIILFVLPSRKTFTGILSFLIGAAVFVLAILAILNPIMPQLLPVFNINIEKYILWDHITAFIYIFSAGFTFLFALFSAKFIKHNLGKYFAWFFLAAASSLVVILAKNWFLFVIFWSIAGLSIYLIMQSQGKAAAAANKTIILFGVGDGFIVFAIALIFKFTGNFAMQNVGYHGLIFWSLIIAAFVKSGVMPFHTWLPDFAADAPASATAFLPAALDKFIGIYLLIRIFQYMKVPYIDKMIILIIGGITIIAAVFMALRQHTGKRLLAYHAVSQVGYMVVGVAAGAITGSAAGYALGTIAALFHLLNNTIYKSALFLGMGYVEQQKGTDSLGKLGGLSGVFPITFISMLVAAVSISGIPPFNGFYSKWLIYQAIIGLLGKSNTFIVILVLLAALFGSALTLASFVKLIHSVFLGGSSRKKQRVKEPFAIYFPQVVLSAACVALGLGASVFFLKPVFGKVVEIGQWQPVMTGIIYSAGIALGIIIYLLSSTKIRRDEGFIGGEVKSEAMKMSGVEFYSSIENMRPFRLLYKLAARKWFDIYHIARYIVGYFKSFLAFLHTGMVNNYISWVFLGAILIFILVK